MNLTEQETRLIRLIVDATLESIEAACKADGFAVSGHIYAALSTIGLTLDQYEGVIRGLIRAGRIELHDDHTITMKEGRL